MLLPEILASGDDDLLGQVDLDERRICRPLANAVVNLLSRQRQGGDRRGVSRKQLVNPLRRVGVQFAHDVFLAREVVSLQARCGCRLGLSDDSGSAVSHGGIATQDALGLAEEQGGGGLGRRDLQSRRSSSVSGEEDPFDSSDGDGLVLVVGRLLEVGFASEGGALGDKEVGEAVLLPAEGVRVEAVLGKRARQVNEPTDVLAFADRRHRVGGNGTNSRNHRF